MKRKVILKKTGILITAMMLAATSIIPASLVNAEGSATIEEAKSALDAAAEAAEEAEAAYNAAKEASESSKTTVDTAAESTILCKRDVYTENASTKTDER